MNDLTCGLTGSTTAEIIAAINANSAKPNRNLLINGGFDIWQRGTSFTAGIYTYTADRFTISRGGYVSGATVDKIGDYGDYRALIRRVSGNSDLNNILFLSIIETAETKKVSGKKITISATLKSRGGLSSINNEIVLFCGGTTEDDTGNISRNSGGGFNIGNTILLSENVQLTTTPARHSFTITVDASINTLQIGAYFTPTGTASDDGFEIYDIQLEEGSVATPFEKRLIGLELSLCQRYYEKGIIRLRGYGTSSLAIGISTPFKVQKRELPIVVFSSTTYANSSNITNEIASKDSLSTYVTVNANGGANYYTEFSADAEL